MRKNAQILPKKSLRSFGLSYNIFFSNQQESVVRKVGIFLSKYLKMRAVLRIFSRSGHKLISQHLGFLKRLTKPNKCSLYFMPCTILLGSPVWRRVLEPPRLLLGPRGATVGQVPAWNKTWGRHIQYRVAWKKKRRKMYVRGSCFLATIEHPAFWRVSAHGGVRSLLFGESSGYSTNIARVMVKVFLYYILTTPILATTQYC